MEFKFSLFCRVAGIGNEIDQLLYIAYDNNRYILLYNVQILEYRVVIDYTLKMGVRNDFNDYLKININITSFEDFIVIYQKE